MTATASAFACACNQALDTAKQLGTSHKIKLQHACYQAIRQETGLTANLVIRAIARVAGAIKSAASKGKTVLSFHPTSIDYDQRVFAYREADESVSLSTLHGRMQIPLVLGEYQRQALAGLSPTVATVSKHGKTWYIHIVIEPPDAAPPKGRSFLGLDLGIRNIATLSTGEQFPGNALQAYKATRAKVRASLSSKGTKGAKRLLKRLSGKERRHTRDENHA